MGSKLSSLLVQEGLIAVKTLEDAFALQAILGGELDTVLLEKNLVGESALVQVASRATGIPAAQPELFERLSSTCTAVIDEEMARRLGICPVELDRKNVTLLVTESTDSFALEDLAFDLDRRIHPFIAVELRVAQARGVVYGTPLSPRHTRLLQQHGPIPPGVPELPSRSEHTIEPARRPVAPSARPLGVTILEPLATIDSEVPVPERGSSEGPERHATSSNDLDLPKVVVDPTLVEQVDRMQFGVAQGRTKHLSSHLLPDRLAEMPPIPRDSDSEDAGIDALEMLPEQELLPEDPAIGDAWEESTDPGGPPTVVEMTADPAEPGEVIQDEFEEDTDPGRGPFLTGHRWQSLDELEHEPSEEMPEEPAPEEPAEAATARTPLTDLLASMQRASRRDDLLVLLGQGVGQFVDRVKIYVVKGDLLVGHLEPGEDTQRFKAQPPIALEIPTVVARAVESGALYMGPVPDTDASVSVLAAAGMINPKGLVLLPVVIRHKTVCLVVGYTTTRPIAAASRGPLTSLAEGAALAMAELIVRLKRGPGTVNAQPPAVAETKHVEEQRHVAETKHVEEERHVAEEPGGEAPDLILLLHQLEQGGTVADAAEATIQTLGREAIQSLVSWFPGQIHVDRLAGDLPPVRQCSAILWALVSIGRPVLSAVAPLLLHSDRETRFFATYLLSDLVYPESVALLARQLSDPDPDIRRVAARVLRQFRATKQFPQLAADLRHDLTNPDVRPRRGAVEALGALGDEGAVRQLLDLLTDPDPTLVQTVQIALANITKRDFGTNSERWGAWWDENQHQGRMEWLIDGLIHDDPAIRVGAAAELEELTGKRFGYSYDMPPRERDAIRRRFLEWWSLQK